MNIIGATSRYESLLAGTLIPTEGCQHARVLHGGGASISDDLCTCVDCGMERYEESFPATADTELRKRPKINGVNEAVNADTFAKAHRVSSSEAPLFAVLA